MKSGAMVKRWNSTHLISRVSPVPNFWVMNILRRTCRKNEGKHKEKSSKTATKTKRSTTGRNVNLLVDTQAKMQAGKECEW